MIDELLKSDPNAVWLNQYANMANKDVHAEQTANEIAREFDQVDWVSWAPARLVRSRGSQSGSVTNSRISRL